MHTRQRRILALVSTALLLTMVSFLVPSLSAPTAVVSASPGVVASGMVEIPIPTSAEGLTINLVTGETSTTGDQPDGWDVQITDRLVFVANTRRPAREAGFVSRLERRVGGAYNLPLGFEVKDGLPFLNGQQPTDDDENPTHNWVFPGDSNYVGVKFWNEATAAYHYGWMRICVSENLAVEPRALVEYGYESTPGAPIDVGAGGVGDPSDCGSSGLTELIRPFCWLAQDIRSDTISNLLLEATPSCSELRFINSPLDDGNVQYFNLPEDPRFQAPWENTTMQGPAGKPVDVILSGLDYLTLLPAYYGLTLRTLTLKDVNLDPNGFDFTFTGRFDGDPIGFTLENASVNWNSQVTFGSPDWEWPGGYPLDFRARGGDSRLLGMKGEVASPTTLTVEPGTTLQCEGCGKLGSGQPDTSRLYFTQNSNQANIDGGTFEIRDSYVIWGTDSSAMLVQNNGQLVVVGGDTVLRAAGNLRAETGGSIKLGRGGAVIDAEEVILNNGSIDVAAGDQLRADGITVTGGNNNMVTLNQLIGVVPVISRGVIVDGDGSTLSLKGNGTLETDQLVMGSSGSLLQLTEATVLNISSGVFQSWSSGSIEIAPDATLLIASQAQVESTNSSITVDGAMRVEGFFRPLRSISGTGTLQVINGTQLSAQLEILPDFPVSADPEINMASLSTLKMQLWPSEGKSSQLTANSGFTIKEGTLFTTAYLDLLAFGDAVLAPGTQFEIVKYPDGNVVGGRFVWRADDRRLEDGDEIIVGLNTYRINYNATSITLTVVAPERVKANNDYYTALQDQTLTVPTPGVLDNDVNVTGTPVVVTPPMHGTVTLNPDGSFTYVPDPGFNGDDTFTYQVGTSNVATVYIHVRAQADCTLTAGYWQTHAGTGGAALDTTWLELPQGLVTPFFLSGETYPAVLAEEPEGNAYYILAQQYIAAELNFLRGADPADAQAAFDAATALFNATTPDQAAALDSQARQEWINLASILDDYNNGYIGPGHCTE